MINGLSSAVLYQDKWTIIPKCQLFTGLDDGRLAEGFRVQWIKVDPWHNHQHQILVY